MSLYRKYRPQTFSHLVGQNHVSQTLSNAIKLDKINHAYLFTGPRGTGKTSTARLLSKSINCTNLQESEPCDACDICKDISEGRLIDLIEIDAASNRGIDEMRDLREKINFSPTRARAKVYIIDEVHMLTKEAFNALLKTLEEPPSHVFFILATTEVHKIPETILSRCQRFDFKRIDEGVLIDRLKYIAGEEGIKFEDKALEVISHHAEGGMRDAIGLLEQLTVDGSLTYANVCDVLGISGFESLEKLYDYLLANDVKAGVAEIGTLYVEGNDLSYFNKRFLEYLRKKLLASIEISDSPLSERILKFIEYFQEAYSQSKYATIAQLPLEIAIVRSCEMNNSEPVDAPVEPTVSEAREHKNLNPGNANESPPVEKMEPIVEQESAEKKSPNLDLIKNKFPQVINGVKNPIVKRSLQQSIPFSLNGTVLTLGFPSNFYMDKVMETANRVQIEHAFLDVLGMSLKVVGEVKQREKVVEQEPAVQQESESELEAQVLDIFQGELA